MKSLLFSLLFSLLLAGYTFGRQSPQTNVMAGTVPQKVGIDIDEDSPFANIAYLIRKSVLSEYQGNTNIYIFANDPVELRYQKVESLNGIALIEVFTNEWSYIIEIRVSHGGETNLINENISIPKETLPITVDDMGRHILDLLLAEFPRKAKVEMSEIVVERQTFSEFETLKPTWTGSVALYYQFRNIDVRFNSVNSLTNNGGYNFYFKNNRDSAALSLEAYYQYRKWHAFLNASVNVDGSCVQILLGGGLGLFRSLFVFMPYLYYDRNKLIYDGSTTATFTEGTVTNDIAIPTFHLQGFALGLRLRLNISKSVYFLTDISFPYLFGSYSILFNEGASLQSQEQPLEPNVPHLRLSINYGINDRFRFHLDYIFGIQAQEMEKDSNGETIYDTGSVYYIGSRGIYDFYIDRLEMMTSFYGVGIDYVF